jgi:signal transduction histidine kinase
MAPVSVWSMALVADLARQLADARTIDEAVEQCAAFCAEALRLKTAAWIQSDPNTRWLLDEWCDTPDELDQLERAIDDPRAAAGTLVVRADPAVIVVEDPGDETELVAILGGLLEATIRNLQGLIAIDRKVELGLAVAAHELRGPLLAAHAVLEHELTRPRRASDRLLQRTDTELTRLSDQLDHLLRWSTSRAPLVLGTVDASALLSEAIEACTPPFGRDRVRLRAAEGVMVAADAGYLRIAIDNVLRNALAYSPRNEPVDVCLWGRNEAAWIQVTDRGPGISEADRQSVFEVFARGTASDIHAAGTGLGLFIARQIIRAHGGDIHAGPGPDGVGTSVSISMHWEAARCAS